MFKKSMIGIFIAESPVHCGVGQDVGTVDQPIQRERYTNYPRIQGSEIKGVFRQYYKGEKADIIFGPEGGGDEGGEFASSISFGDGRMLFFPVKSLKGTYVWITCHDVLDKFNRMLKMAGINTVSLPSHSPSDDEHIIVYDSSNSMVVEGDRVILEEYMFKKQTADSSDLGALIDKLIPPAQEYAYLRESLKKKVCVVSNDVFKDFTEMSTEVITRIRIDDKTGVVAQGALWTEEYLPTDSILYFPVFSVDSRGSEPMNAEEILSAIKDMKPYIQIGGNETVGKGFVRLNWLELREADNVIENH